MLQNYLQRDGIFSPNEIEALLSAFSFIRQGKGATFNIEGEQGKEIAFIQSEIFRSFYTTDAGEE